MADEVAVAGATAADVTEATNVATPDATGQQASKTFTQAELDAIVKERLDRAERKAQETTKKATAEAEAKALAEQGEYKKLAERYQAEAAQAAQEAQALKLAKAKRDIADKVGLPAIWVDRLQGETPDDLEADAKSILAMLPKAAPPNINSGPGAGAVPVPGQMTPEEKAELAARYGVNVKYMT